MILEHRLETACCCRHEYGDHKAHAPHACLEPMCACTGFVEPHTEGNERGSYVDRTLRAARSAASQKFEKVVRAIASKGRAA